jgi:hypothetical protein
MSIMASTPESAMVPIANNEIQGSMRRKRMWPSLEVASRLYDWANIWLIIGLVLGAVSTVLIVWMGAVKEGYLKRDLADADLARLKLEEKLAPRRLDANARSGLQSSLQHVARRRVRVESYSLDLEAAMLAGQIRDALSQILVVEDWIGAEPPARNFAKGINITGDDKKLVEALVIALRNVGLLDIGTVELPIDPGGAILEEATPEKNEADAVVLVGVKPIAP